MRSPLCIVSALLFLLLTREILPADQIILVSGDTLSGELIRVTPQGMIVEIRSAESIHDRTFDPEEVHTVIDQGGDTLYHEQRLLVDPEDSFDELPCHDEDPVIIDTIETTDGRRIIARIKEFDEQQIRYRQKNRTQSIPREEIRSINGKPPDSVLSAKIIRNRRRYHFYPRFFLDLGYASVHTRLEQTTFNIPNSYGGVHVGLFIDISSYITAGALAQFTVGFGRDMSDDEDRDGYHLGLIELRARYPLSGATPWIALSYASQSIIYFVDDDRKWKAASKGPGIGAGLNSHVSDDLRLYAAARYLFFPKKAVAEEIEAEVELRNLMFSAGIQIVF